MNIIYLISVIVIIKLVSYFFKMNKGTAKEIKEKFKNTETLLESKQPIDNTIESTKTLGKNKWLYPDDEFVKHSTPKHYKSKKYKIQ